MIGLDIDPPKYVRRNKRQVSAVLAVKAYFAMHRDKPRRKILIWLSTSGKGFHLVRDGDDGSLTKQFKLRQKFGDDPIRVRIDRWKNRSKKIICRVIESEEKIRQRFFRNLPAHTQAFLRNATVLRIPVIRKGSHNFNVLWNSKYGKRAKRISLKRLRRYASGLP